MTRRFGILILISALAGGLTFWLWKLRTPSGPSPAPVDRQPRLESPTLTGTEPDLLQQALGELRDVTAPAQRGQTLAQLRQALDGMAPARASAAIRRFLDSKADGPTGQAFRVSGRGALDGAPTLRTFLLDYLAQVDPAAAAAYARTILSGSDSPDEWALALRNLAQGDHSAEARSLLEQKTGELLRNTAWQEQPSVGYLEAFDAAVYLGGTNLLPELTALVRKQDNQAVAHAAFLALDRLVINQPAPLLQALGNDPALMQGREATRANYFARADVREPEQRRVLESYMLDPHIGAQELEQFAGLFPNANFMVSPNLLTATPTPDHAALTGRDAASLAAVQDWLADQRFSQMHPQLQKLKARLEEFVRQAAR